MGGVWHDKSSEVSVKMHFYFIKNTDIRVINDTKVVHEIKCAVLLLMDTLRQLFFLLVIFLKIPYSDYVGNDKSVTTKISIIYSKTMMNIVFFSKSIHSSSKQIHLQFHLYLLYSIRILLTVFSVFLLVNFHIFQLFKQVQIQIYSPSRFSIPSTTIPSLFPSHLPSP